MKWIKAFAFFWYDFIVGDSLVVGAGAPLTMGLAFGVARADINGVAQTLLPVGIVVTLVASLRTR